MLCGDANTIRALCGISCNHETSSEMSLPGSCRERRPGALCREGACLLLPALKLLRGRESVVSPPFTGDSSFGNSMQPLLVNPRTAEGTTVILTGITLLLDFSRSCKAVDAKGMLRTTRSHLTPVESPQGLAGLGFCYKKCCKTSRGQ